MEFYTGSSVRTLFLTSNLHSSFTSNGTQSLHSMCAHMSKVANPYGLSVRTTEFDLFHSLTAVGPKSYGYKIILRV